MGLLTEIAAQLNISVTALILVIIWTFVWKGAALWKAARDDAKGWFIAILIVSTAGILPILYIYFFRKRGSGNARISKN